MRRDLGLLAVVLAVVLSPPLLSACDDVASSTAASADPAPVDAAPADLLGVVIRPSQGCGLAAPVAPGSTGELSMQVGPLERRYRLHLPPGYDPDTAASLVLDFHGYGGTATNKERYSRLSDHADEHGYCDRLSAGHRVRQRLGGAHHVVERPYLQWLARAGGADLLRHRLRVPIPTGVR